MNSIETRLFAIEVKLYRKTRGEVKEAEIKAITNEFIGDFTEMQSYEDLLLLRAPASNRVLAIDSQMYAYSDASPKTSDEEKVAAFRDRFGRLLKIVPRDEEVNFSIALQAGVRKPLYKPIGVDGRDLLVPERKPARILGDNAKVGLKVEFEERGYGCQLTVDPYSSEMPFLLVRSEFRKDSCSLTEVPSVFDEAFEILDSRALYFVAECVL